MSNRTSSSFRSRICLAWMTVLVTVLSGCATQVQVPNNTPDWSQSSAKTESTVNLAQEQEELFKQPYIDPLTNYLLYYQGDASRSELLSAVRQERDDRCDAIANEYAEREPTTTNLNTYRAGYQYSCPAQVAQFAERVRQQAKQASTKQLTSQVSTEPSDPVSQALADCLLLTSIKNFTDARKACRGPASLGDARAQENMAVIEYAFENYSEAFSWAGKTSESSATSAFLLGRMYLNGYGVDADPALAKVWLQRAADQGSRKATDMLKAVFPNQ